MIRLIYFEVRKHFFTPSMLILLLVFLVLNAVKIRSVYMEASIFSEKNRPEFLETYSELYPAWSGNISEEKRNEVMDAYNTVTQKIDNNQASTEREEGSYTYNAYSDEYFLSECFVEQMDYECAYSEYANTVVKRAVENMKLYEKVGNQYGIRENYELAQAFYGRRLENFYSTDGFRALFYYDFSTFFVLLLGIYGCSSVFVKERETQMWMIVKTSARGHNSTFFAKMTASFLFILVICVIFSLEDYIVFLKNFQYADAKGEPLYILEGFQNTVLRLSLNMSYLLFTVGKCLGMEVLGFLFLYLSANVKNVLYVILSSLGVVALLGFLESFCERAVRFWNPVTLLFGRRMFMNMEFYNLFEYPVPFHWLVYMMAGVNSIILFGLIWRSWKRRWGNASESI